MIRRSRVIVNAMRSPFHHQILPWIFAIVFLAFAPLVVFYTSGYRWNVKKGKVEQNSTLIVDSEPSGASIILDGRRMEAKTPITLREISPGTHSLTVEKTGYHTWEKTLELRPERATFANGIWLWKTAEPQQLSPEPIFRLSQSTDERYQLAFIDGTTTRVVIFDTWNNTHRRLSLSPKLFSPLRVTWSGNAFALLETSIGAPHLLNVYQTSSVNELPAAQYRWEGESLVGHASNTRYLLHPPSQKFLTEILAVPFADQLGDSVLKTQQDGLILTSTRAPTRGVLLPPGAWRLWDQRNDVVLLRDGNRWMSVQDRNGSAEIHEARGDELRPSPTRAGEEYLLAHQGELWLWNPTQEPELLYRQSDPLVATAWHRKGSDVFFATSREVFALNLDPRSGRRRTTLATFDSVFDLLALKDHLLIAATRAGVQGMWKLETE